MKLMRKKTRIGRDNYEEENNVEMFVVVSIVDRIEKQPV
jgi:hypothetical protein